MEITKNFVIFNYGGFVKNRNFTNFVIPAPYQVRGKLQRESSKFK